LKADNTPTVPNGFGTVLSHAPDTTHFRKSHDPVSLTARRDLPLSETGP
jgi:hypothetical protein